MTKPVRMTHTQASKVLSNWWRLSVDYPIVYPIVYSFEATNTATRINDIIAWRRYVSLDAVAACIEVVERGRRRK